MKINLVAEIIGGTSGFNQHGKGLFKCLTDSGHDVAIETNLSKGWEAITNEVTRKAIEKNYNEETTIFIGHPHYTQHILSDRPKHFIQFLIFEGDSIPKFWVPILNADNVNQVWVASDDTKKAAVSAGVKEDKIFVVSHGVDCDVFKPVEVERKDERFTFFYNKGYSKGEDDRSGMSDLIIAFSKEFKKEEPVRLVLKINGAYVPPGWDLNAEIAKLKEKYKLEFKDNLSIIIQDLTEGQLNEMYNQADCFVAPTRGEAFGFTIAEALACGLPVIATDQGGHLDFCTMEDTTLVKSKLKPSPELPVYEGINWNYCDTVDLQKKMREAYNLFSKDKPDKEHIRKAIKDKFEWKNTAKKANKSLDLL